MGQRKLMAVGAHADDIELNVGGTLAKYSAMDYDIAYVMATNNMSGSWSRLRPDGRGEKTQPPWHEIMPQRKKEAAAAAALFGTEAIHLDHPQRHYIDDDGNTVTLTYGCDRPDCVPPGYPSILTACSDESSVKRVADLIMGHDPEAILTHGNAAGNIEHFATCLLTVNAYWEAVDNGYEGMLLQWPELGIDIYGMHSFQWDTYVDVSEYWDAKLEAIGKHACQIPDPLQLDLPEWSAASGCERAEVFIIVGRNERVAASCEFSLEILSNSRS